MAGGESVRPYVFVVYGATGFTGRLVASYLHTHDDVKGLRWAIAGRNEGKLLAVRDEVLGGSRDVGIIVADTNDAAAIDAMTRQTQVVLNTAGPFLECGAQIIDKCVATSTHYCDITGEVTWVKRMMQRYGTQAEANGVTLVPMSGFDSAPADLGAMLVTQRAQDSNETIKSVTGYIMSDTLRGGISGGTLSSIRNIVLRDSKEVARSAFDMGYLCFPATGTQQSTSSYSISEAGPSGMWYARDMPGWTSPWFGAVNAKVVHRTSFLQAGGGGPFPLYSEALLHKSFFTALVATMAFYAFVLVILIPPLRWAAFKFFLAQPGKGPAPETLRNGRLDIVFVGKTDAAQPICVNFGMRRDPAYQCTAMMLVEVALILYTSDDVRSGRKSGFQTPASVGGMSLVNRLRKAEGCTAFSIEHM
eukprot:TRINITY_DN43925_c0_g1_i1.p1 TRINITY_DN43925_c0_g1~~TRINITY_DN43925_c0_g1_i1.p1  ORF type:complete len:418 (+),score=134.44 TRINITY_DN43925_c0_g1_i1:165-1418(+)